MIIYIHIDLKRSGNMHCVENISPVCEDISRTHESYDGDVVKSNVHAHTHIVSTKLERNLYRQGRAALYTDIL